MTSTLLNSLMVSSTVALDKSKQRAYSTACKHLKQASKLSVIVVVKLRRRQWAAVSLLKNSSVTYRQTTA